MSKHTRETGDWTTPEARAKAHGVSEADAQERLYELSAKRAALGEQISKLNDEYELHIEDARALLEIYPTLKLGVRK